VRLRAAALVLCGALVYANSLSGPFVRDDAAAIVENPTILSLWPVTGPLDPPRETPVAGRPLVNLTFALNFAAGGFDVGGYHAVNILGHVLVGLLLAGVVRRTLQRPALPDLLGSKAAALSWACAFVWLVHPLNTEVVSYLTQRTEGLMAVFYFSTLYCAVRALDDPHGRAHGATEASVWWRCRWDVGAVLSCAAGMASKESMVTAPVMVALYDRVFVFGSARQALAQRRFLYGGLAATWVLLLGLMSTGPRSSVGFGSTTSGWDYFLNQLEIVGRYLWLTVWPRALVVDYGLPRAMTLGDVAVPGIALLGLGALTLVALYRAPFVGFLGAWFFVTLAPTSSVVPIATEVGAERRMYLPLAGLVVLIVIGGYWLAARRWPRARLPVREVRPASHGVGRARVGPTRGRNRRVAPGGLQSSHLSPIVSAVVTGVCAVLALGTVIRNAEYRDPLTLAETVVERRPHGRARFALADELIKAGQRDRAIAELRLAVQDYPQAHFGLANELAAVGRLDEATGHVREFIRRVPESPVLVPARDMLGRFLANQGQLDAAAAEFVEVLRLRPDYLSAAVALGNVRTGQGRFAEAAVQFRQVLAAAPDDIEAVKGLALVERLARTVPTLPTP
jgi:protein O-mannosyl-transferase